MARGKTPVRQAASRPQLMARSGRAGGRRSRIRTVVVLVSLALGILLPFYVLATRASSSSAGPASAAVDVLQTADFHSLAVSPDDPSIVFFGHHNGLMRSADGGRTFSPLVERGNYDAMNLTAGGANPRDVYVAGHEVFQVSHDGGASWQPVENNLPDIDIHGFAMNPDAPHDLYALAVRYGLFNSKDGGHTWQRLQAQLPGDVLSLAAAGGQPEVLYAVSMRAG
jgi:hypothetical protein